MGIMIHQYSSAYALSRETKLHGRKFHYIQLDLVNYSYENWDNYVCTWQSFVKSVITLCILS